MKKTHAFQQAITCFTLLTATGLAVAQEGVPVPAGAMIIGEGLWLYPSVNAKLGYDDNVRATQTDTIGSSQFTLLPKLRAEAKTGATTYNLTYSGEYTGYGNSSEDNFNNHDLQATGAHTLDVRHRLNWSLGFQDRVDPRSEPGNTSPEPDQWRGTSATALYRFGAEGAQGRVEVEYGFNRKRYQNNPATAASSDTDGNRLVGRFFWRVMPKTYLVTEAAFGRNDYRSGNGSATDNDNTDQRLLIGATWEATAKTSGTIKLGHQKKRFDGSGRTGASGFTYDAAVDWSPLSYSTLSFTAGRSADDSTSSGDYQKTQRLGVNWSHQWSSQWSSRVNLSQTSNKFVNDTREDDTLSSGLGLSYQFRRNIQLGLDYTHTRRDSTSVGADYKRNSVLFSVNAGL